jgi:hypothetical protein
VNTGVCRYCEKRLRELLTAYRTGGGTYRRPPREYRSSICLPCARELLVIAPTHAMATVEHWSVRSLRNAVERAERQIASAPRDADGEPGNVSE